MKWLFHTCNTTLLARKFEFFRYPLDMVEVEMPEIFTRNLMNILSTDKAAERIRAPRAKLYQGLYDVILFKQQTENKQTVLQSVENTSKRGP